jgi:hypothetical protein
MTEQQAKLLLILKFSGAAVVFFFLWCGWWRHGLSGSRCIGSCGPRRGIVAILGTAFVLAVCVFFVFAILVGGRA